jgi:hypothetical protein
LQVTFCFRGEKAILPKKLGQRLQDLLLRHLAREVQLQQQQQLKLKIYENRRQGIEVRQQYGETRRLPLRLEPLEKKTITL